MRRENPILHHPTHKRLLLHLNTLMLQQVGRLVEDLHALGALERPVLTHHALVLMRVRQVGDIMTAGRTLVSSLCGYLQGGSAGWRAAADCAARLHAGRRRCAAGCAGRAAHAGSVAAT